MIGFSLTKNGQEEKSGATKIYQKVNTHWKMLNKIIKYKENIVAFLMIPFLFLAYWVFYLPVKKFRKTFSRKTKKFLIGIGILGVAGASTMGIPFFNEQAEQTYTVCDPLSPAKVSITNELENLKTKNPDNSLRALNSSEKAAVKSCEISKLNHVGQFTDQKYGISVEIQSLKAIEINGSHGVEIMARAWKGTEQLGFGKDGSVEIERFRIFDPPIKIQDPNGSIDIAATEARTGLIKHFKWSENPIEAIKQTLAYVISVVGKENTEIVKGSIGNTTSTFHPDLDAESTSVDGDVRETNAGTTWATIQGAAGDSATDSVNTMQVFIDTSASDSNLWINMRRIITLFDTSAIPDTDTISSATISLYGNSIYDYYSAKINIYSSAPASNTSLAAGDYDSLGTTAFSTAQNFTGFSTASYNVFTLNALGIADINKAGISKFGARESLYDAPNTEPSPRAVFEESQLIIWSADGGDTVWPLLIVEHDVAAAAASDPQYELNEGIDFWIE